MAFYLKLKYYKMKIHRFFLQTQIGDKEKVKIVEPDLVHQIRTVLRLSEGQEVVLLDVNKIKY